MIAVERLHAMILCFTLCMTAAYAADRVPYLDPQVPIDLRVEDLLARMTLEEKIGQLNVPCVYRPQLGGEISHLTHIVPDDPLGETIKPGFDREAKEGACRQFVLGRLPICEHVGPGGGFFTLANTILPYSAARQADFFNALQRLAVEGTRLGIPLLQVEEGTHGFMATGGTVFPEGLAIGSSWNMDLVGRLYAAAAAEARCVGVHMLCTLVVEPNIDPRLGRNAEGYSEDPLLCSRIAESLVAGMQGDAVSAPDRTGAVLCHFPGQSQPVSGMEYGAMEMSERSWRTVFLPPWVAGLRRAGALGVMATHPSIDVFEGMPAHASKALLTGLLRNEFGFRGVVLSEGLSVGTILWKNVAVTQEQGGRLGLDAGLDISISLEPGFADDLYRGVKQGLLDIAAIDRSVRRVLRLKFLLGLFENPYVNPKRAGRIQHSRANQQLALQAAREGIVLLKNQNELLPLAKDIASIAVIGPNADEKRPQLGDYAPRVLLHDVVTVLEGIRSAVSSDTRVTYVRGCDVLDLGLDEIESARAAAAQADAAVVVVGENQDSVGEKRDAARLELTGRQSDLVRAVCATGTPTVVVLINGRPLAVNECVRHAGAILEAWNCGERGGEAVAEALFGDINPSGRLPITIPRHAGQLPVYYFHKPSKAQRWSAGYVDLPADPLFEFGFGLSYTTFDYSRLSITPSEIGPAGRVEVAVDVGNSGGLAGAEVVQLYLNDIVSSVTTPLRQLRGFRKIHLQPGETRTVRFVLDPQDLALLDRNLEPVVEPGEFEVQIGRSCDDILLRGRFRVRQTLPPHLDEGTGRGL